MNKLELNWIGKYDNEINPEPRILIENEKYSYKAESQGQLELAEETEPTYDNILIHGDNLLALKSLEMEYAGKVKCIYIDPPYNTGSAFEHYDDNLEHSTWLNLMKPRLEILRNLLSDDGSIWISIDNSEGHYLKVVCDEIFKRQNFVADITYEKSNVSGLGQGGMIVNTGEKILVYKKKYLELNEVLGTEKLALKTMKRYNKMLIDEGEKELIEEFPASSNKLPVKIFKHSNYKIDTISLRDFKNREPIIRQEFYRNFEKMFRTYIIQKENEFQNSLMDRMEKDSLYSVEYTPNRGKNKDIYTTLYYHNAELCAWLKDTAFIENEDIVKTIRLSNVWKNDDIPKADLGNEGGVTFQRSKKPEKLLERILKLSTNKGDLVLDSFLGSGTTAAVAHKMGRKWIGIELGDHAYTHCYERLKAVIDGEQGGISKAVNWKGGGGFKFYELAPSVFQKTPFGNMVISEKYNADMLAAAIARHEGYTYCPDEKVFWKQGYSGEKNFIFTTTEYITKEYLEYISGALAEDEYILIYSTQFDETCSESYKNIIVKQIPKSLLGRCEYDKDNYNLNVIEQETDWEEDDE